MNIYKEILRLEETNSPFVVATVIASEGSVPGKVGFKLLIKSDSATTGTIGGGALETEVIKESLKRLSENSSGMKEYILSDNPEIKTEGLSVVPMKCSGKVAIFYEVYKGLSTVYIFGGGHVGNALLYYLSPLKYHTVLIDNRKEFANSEKNPNAKEIILKDYPEYANEFKPDKSFYAVILTHEHKFDYQILKALYERDLEFKYIGVIASRSKAASMIDNLKKDLGEDIDLSRLHTPVGLKIGGNTAEEIALAIVAEIQSVKYAG